MTFVWALLMFVLGAENIYGQPLVNLARGRPTNQSTTWKDIYTSERAVDGNVGKRFYRDTCTHTRCDDFDPFWYVELDHDYTIERVVIHNPCEACTRLKNIRVEVFETDPTLPNAVGKLCATIDGTPAPDGKAVTLTCTQGIWGRYIRISKMVSGHLWRRNKCDSLQLCEVEVFGPEYINCAPGFIRNEDSCYYFSRAGLTGSWIQAQQYCEAMNGYLTIIDTAEEDTFIRNHALNNGVHNFYWTGGSDMLVEGTFRWMSRVPNELVTYTNWAPLQPNNNGNNAHCIELNGPFNFEWNDEDCSWFDGFICEQN